MSKKYLIVGHGLAGAVLAHTLRQKGQDVRVIDARLPNAASKVSAGLINPFIGPKFNLPYDFDQCMEANFMFLKKFDSPEKNFIRAIKLIRVFISKKQQDRWSSLSEKYKIDMLLNSDCRIIGIKTKFGAGLTTAWQFETQKFLQVSREILCSENRLIIKPFNKKDWPGHDVIFCEGYRVRENEWFKELPFSPAQGDILTIKSVLNEHVSNGTWHSPDSRGANTKLGSTWKHNDFESGPSKLARTQILKNLTFLPDDLNIKIINQVSGVRSGTFDRNPIMGRHPKLSNYYLFNGFGSRGSTTIALSAMEFANFLIDQKPIPERKSILRFLSDYKL